MFANFSSSTGGTARPRSILPVLVACSLLVLASQVKGQGLDSAATVKPLRISLFPYVPNGKLIEQIVREKWAAAEKDVPLEFVTNWDGYKKDPDPDLDVFEFDAINLEYFVRNNHLAALRPDDVGESEDFLDFAWQGAMVDGVIYGAPHWGCGYVLFYRKGDAEVERAVGLKDLYAALGDAPTAVPPEMNRGLLIDLTSGTDCASLFLDAQSDVIGRYTVKPQLRTWFDVDDTQGLANLRLLGKMAGKEQALYADSSYGKRPAWFGEGRGRALVGYSERLYYIPKELHDTVRARSLPMADQNRVNSYFMDMVGINAGLRGERRKLAIKLMNIVTASESVLKTLLPPNSDKPSQYLLPLRKGVLTSPELLSKAPLYRDLYAMVLPETQPKVFRLSEEGRRWLVQNKNQIRTIIFPE